MDDEGREDEMVPRSKVVLCLAFSESPSNLCARTLHASIHRTGPACRKTAASDSYGPTANMNHGTIRSVESKMELEPHYLDLSWILSNNSFIKHVYNMSAPNV